MAAQVELARAYEVPRRRSASATVVAMLITLATGLLVAAVALPLSSGAAARQYWWALALAPPALIALYPPVMGWALDRALRLARRPPLERRISGSGVLRAVAWSLAGWAFFSVHAWLLVAGVTGKGVSVLPIAAGAYALAWSVGFVLIPFPGGVGPRELALIAALAPVMPRGSAIVVAVVSRLVLTIGDLVWAAVAFGLGRGGRHPARGGARRDCGPGPGQRRRSGRGRRRARGREQLRRAGSGGRARERRSHPGRRRCCGPDGERHSCACRRRHRGPGAQGRSGHSRRGDSSPGREQRPPLRVPARVSWPG